MIIKQVSTETSAITLITTLTPCRRPTNLPYYWYKLICKGVSNLPALKGQGVTIEILICSSKQYLSPKQIERSLIDDSCIRDVTLLETSYIGYLSSEALNTLITFIPQGVIHEN